MTTTIHLCLLLVIALAGSLNPQTEGSQSALASSIENSIKSKEPGWEFSAPAREAQPNSTLYRWKSGEERIRARVFVTDSPEAAAKQLNEFSRHVPVPPKVKLKSPGDEALLYQGENTNGCMILFRRGNVFVSLSGSSVVHAKRFAKHLDDLFALK